MLDDEPAGGGTTPPADTTSTNHTSTGTTGTDSTAPAKAAKKTTRRVAKKAAPAATELTAPAEHPSPAARTARTAPAEPAATAAPAESGESAPAKKAARRAIKKAAPAAERPLTEPAEPASAPPVRKATRRATKKAAPPPVAAAPTDTGPVTAGPAVEGPAVEGPDAAGPDAAGPVAGAAKATRRAVRKAAPAVAFTPPVVAFVAPSEQAPEQRPPSRAAKKAARPARDAEPAAEQPGTGPAAAPSDEETEDGANRRRRRGRRGRGRGKGGEDGADQSAATESTPESAVEPTRQERVGADQSEPTDDEGADTEREGTSRRRRRRRRGGANGDSEADEGTGVAPPAAAKPREPRKRAAAKASDEVQGVRGSTRLEAKRQRRRDGRGNDRKRPPVVSEAEFLARRESVERVMAVRQVADRTQIVTLEDGVLVEHYVTKASSTSYAGNIYLGRVQNVLPSMEAAFVDIGKGRNAVLYAGEVNWDAAGLGGKPRRIEEALKAGQPVLVQVTKDPIGHKGARLTSQISLPGRFLVYVPEGSMTGISRRLPDTERKRLKDILKKIIPEDAGVIIRTASEGASAEELTSDVQRLRTQWEALKAKADSSSSAAPTKLYEEPNLAIRVVRDVFNGDFAKLVVSGEQGWTTVKDYVDQVAPDLADRLSHHTGESDLFGDLRVDEQLAKALDRKVFLPSGGSLVIDRTEAMTVVDVNTGKFTGHGGNLEETVTRNNLEAAEEIVRQLRLRDVGGIIVVDFIDMVLEANRDLVLRRLTECLGRDRTKHQVAEVTSLGLVQMTRQRVGQGLLESFSEVCETCNGRGVIVHSEPVTGPEDQDATQSETSNRRRGRAEKPSAVLPVRSNGELHKIHEAALRRIQAEPAVAAAGQEPTAVEETGVRVGGQAAPDRDRGRADVGADSAMEPDEDLTDSVDDAIDGAIPGVVGGEDVATEPAPRRRRRAASRPAGPAAGAEPERAPSQV